ncbi:MAG TPA: hypothetical protein VGD17_17305, partial [Chitinophagaceae bacterium]
QPNEKHLADKLQHVPVPEMESSWQQMRELLDRDMPEGVAGAWSGNKKWWWMGLTAAFIMVATWLLQPFKEQPVFPGTENSGAVSANQTKTDNNSNTDKNAVSKGNIKQRDVTSKNNDQDPDKAVSNNTNDITKAATSDAITNKQEQSSPANKGIAATDKERNDVSQNSIRNSEPNESGNGKLNKDVLNQNETKNIIAAKSGSQSGQKNKPYRSSTQQRTKTNADLSLLKDKDNKKINDEITVRTPEILQTGNIDRVITEETSEEVRMPQIDFTIIRSGYARPSDVFEEIKIKDVAAVAVSGRTDKEFRRELRKRSIKDDNRKLTRASMRGNYGDNERDITFAAGLALPYNVAISGQQTSAYNINARTSRIGDFLPAPFFQYHINNRLFLQTEFHFQSPQFTERLLFSSQTKTSGNIQYENKSYLEKLYYFNIPFNVYYSPARNFFIGSGVQYSSLLGGVASYEQRSTQGSTVLGYQSDTRRFKDDSVASVFSPNEWRYQFDANYYFRRFTFGLRFNQAMRDFIDLPASTNLPLIQQRNRSFLLYLRFNIWEERKKLAD